MIMYAVVYFLCVFLCRRGMLTTFGLENITLGAQGSHAPHYADGNAAGLGEP